MGNFLNKKKTVILIGHGFFMVYLFMTLYFYQERTTLFDSGIFSFHILQKESFFFPLDRYGCSVTQLIPVLLLKFTNCSIETFLISFSLSIGLFYYTIFLVIAYVLKNYRLIIIFLLSISLTYQNTFYFGVSEFSQGLALSVLLYGIIEQMLLESRRNKQILLFLCSIALIFSSYYFHPLTFIAILFVIMVIILKNKYYFNRQLIVLLLFTLFWFGINIFLKSNSEGYEAERMSVFKEFFSNTPSLFNLPSLQYFFGFIKGTPLISFLIIFLIGSITLKRNVLLGLFFIIYPFVYLFFNVVIYHKGEAPNMYEQYYIYFGFFAAIILFDSQLITKTKHQIVFGSFLLLVSLSSMYLAHKFPTKKIEYLSKLIEKGNKYSYKKYIMPSEDYWYAAGWSTWAISVESLLLSSLQNYDENVVFYVPKSMEEIQPKREKGRFYCDRSINKDDLWISNLNTRFFNLPEHTNYITVKRPHNVVYFKQKIKESKEWLTLIEKKALENGLTIERMIELDAKWLADDVLTKENIIKEKENQIKSDSIWLKAIQEKAIRNNIPLSEMINIDAKYIMQQTDLTN